jgi:RNA polymerase sigma-70 factor (ECF subfamily)
VGAEHVSDAEARAVAERAARASYGRIVAVVAASSGDLQLAEDAVATAFERALITWPVAGVPRNPEGWLVTVARNQQRDVWKSSSYRDAEPLTERAAVASHAAFEIEDIDPDAIPDKRLELLFVCAHPAIEPTIRTPLMLQAVLGFDAARIATAFAVPAQAMAARLVRAKRRIKGARIPFIVPGRDAMPERLPPVLEAIYGCYAIAGPGADASALGGEAQYLAVTAAALLPSSAEAWGLAALITLSRARSAARSDRFVPLDEQDVRSWDSALIAEGESYLRRATPVGAPGRFQLEAAIQAVHCARARTGVTDWKALRALYAALLVVAPSIGAQVARAAVVGHIDGPAAGLALLEGLAADAARLQPYHVVMARLLGAAGRLDQAADAYERAIALTDERLVRKFLEAQKRRLLTR